MVNTAHIPPTQTINTVIIAPNLVTASQGSLSPNALSATAISLNAKADNHIIATIPTIASIPLIKCFSILDNINKDPDITIKNNPRNAANKPALNISSQVSILAANMSENADTNISTSNANAVGSALFIFLEALL